MSKSPNAAEITVIDQRVTLSSPRIGETYYTVIVTYRRGSDMPRTLFMGLTDIAKGKEVELNTQISAKKGPLYEQFLTYRAKKIKEDLERLGAFKPETVRF
jgi:hypothetical protein